MIFCLPVFLFGQSKSEIGLFLGASNHGTDVHSYGTDGVSFFKGTGLAYGLHYTYNFNHAFGLRLGYTGTKLEGDDTVIEDLVSHPLRGYTFTTPLHEVGLSLQWNFLNRKDSLGNQVIKKFSPYVLVGGALSFTNPEVDFSQTPKPTANATDLADVTKTNFQLPFGLGFKYNFSDKMYLGLEARGMYPMGDYIDGISVSANPDNNDSYLFYGLNFGLKLGKNDMDGDGIADEIDICPEIPGLEEFAGCPDTDGDGVPDNKDECPLISGEINLVGCPDTDGDGIANKYDDCPNIAGEKRFKGCPDTDNDGIRDIDDKCPKVKGLKKYDGCLPDADGDGVVDSEDKCPNVKGKINGCPDTDGDGVIDMEDNCPKVRGNVQGCPDTDGDGIIDNNDKCPDTPGIVANNGCPAVKKEVKEKIISIAKAIYFKTGSDELRSDSKKKLNELVGILNEYVKMGFAIEGHTDSRGDDAKNMILSQKRANAVKNFLVSKGINSTRLNVQGFGETTPIADNATSNGRQMNRRVELRSTF